MLVDLINRKHELITGQTRSGKSHYALQKFMQSPEAGIYFDPQAQRLGHNLIKIDCHSSKHFIIKALKNKKKLHYVALPGLVNARKECDIISELIYELVRDVSERNNDQRRLPLTCVFDEAQDFAPEGDRKAGLLLLARRGLGMGVRCYFLAQR